MADKRDTGSGQSTRQSTDKRRQGTGIALGMPLGAGTGVGFGVVMDDLARWLAVGVAAGLGIVAALDVRRNR